jgi:multiple sugar transport system permease protein
MIFVVPALIFFLVFRFVPALMGGLMSLTDYKISGQFDLIGLDNYVRLAGDGTFWRALGVSALYAIMAVPLGAALSVIFAVLTRRISRTNTFLQSVYFLPAITSGIVTGIVFRWVFSSAGPWPALMRAIGFPVELWLASEVFALPAIVLTGAWSFGFGMFIILAKLREIPPEIEEAATLDGAGPVRQFFSITLPELRLPLEFIVITGIVAALQIFDTVYVMTGGGPANATFTVAMQVYQQGFRYFDFGYAAAIGMALFAVTLAITAVQRFILRRRERA